MPMITKTHGTWDPKAWPVYFGAAEIHTLEGASPCLEYMLVAVNELRNDMDLVHTFIDKGIKVLIDSGVYWLSTQHAKNHNVTMDVALGLAPDKIDGFDELFERYTTLLKDIGDRAWGYIEIDQGGRENKMKTRARLEKMGFRPIPVYHPFNDGWEYFDYLAERYDRICFGNVVQADTPTRKRLIATAWERRRKYPHLWIHALGMTPSDIITAFPVNSCDSSSWISSVRWGQHHVHTANVVLGNVDDRFIYDLDDRHHEGRGHMKARLMCGYDAFVITRTMRGIAEEQRQVLGADIGLFGSTKRKR